MNEKEFLISLTNEIKDYALDGFYKDFNIRTKQDGSIVTDIDLMVEKKIFKKISKFFPEDSFLGEETGFHRGKNSTMWVVDPIDGTRAFSQHRSEWGVLIARSVEGVVKTGIVVCPVQDIFTVVHNNELVYTSFDYKNLNKNISDKISILIEDNFDTSNVNQQNFSILQSKNQFCKDVISIGFSDFDAIITYAPFPHDRLAYEPIVNYMDGAISKINGTIVNPMEEDIFVLITKNKEVKKQIVNGLFYIKRLTG